MLSTVLESERVYGKAIIRNHIIDTNTDVANLFNFEAQIIICDIPMTCKKLTSTRIIKRSPQRILKCNNDHTQCTFGCIG